MTQDLSNLVPVLIIGDSPVRVAIKNVLDLFNITCDFQVSISQSCIELRPDSIILSLSKPCEAIRQVNHFRKYKWEGIFIILASNVIEKNSIENLSIFGEKNGKFAYKNIRGHTVTLPHLLINDILLSQGKMGLSTHLWHDYIIKSSVYNLIHKLQQDLISIDDLLASIHELDLVWDAIFSHEQAYYIYDLKEKYPPGIKPSVSEGVGIRTYLQSNLPFT
jgi:hypothetical protein